MCSEYQNKGLRWRRTGRVQDCLRELLHNEVMALTFLFSSKGPATHFKFALTNNTIIGDDVSCFWCFRYVEKQPGKFVGDTGCEKLPVEVFALLIVIMGMIMVLVGVNDDSCWWQLFHLENRFAELVALSKREPRSATTRWITTRPIFPFQLFFWIFSALYCNSVGHIGAILGNRLPSRRSWRDLRPEPSEDLQVKKQGEIIEDLFSENSGNNRKPVFKNRGK